MNDRFICSIARGSAPRTTVAIACMLALGLGGCKSKPAVDDATLTTQVDARLFADQNLSGQAIRTSVAGGVVTLDGSVSSDTARTIASGDAAQVAGVKTVVNNLTVGAPEPTAPAGTATPASASVVAPPPAPIHTEKEPKPSPTIPSHKAPVEAPPSVAQPAPIVRAYNQQAPAPSAPPVQQAPAPPQPPVVHTITLPAGTDLPIRITQTLDSATTQTGDKFSGAIASDIVVDGLVVLAQGTPVTGHVDAVQDAAHFKGSSLLTLSLSSIDRKSERLTIATEPFTKEGVGRGKNTIEKVGAGAAVGAILGGIFGGGKGAAIGSIAGGGVGAGAQAATRGEQVQIPSETVVRFKLTSPVQLHVGNGGTGTGNPASTLERHPGN